MAKKSMIQREKKREKLVLQYSEKRQSILLEFKRADNFMEQWKSIKKYKSYQEIVQELD